MSQTLAPCTVESLLGDLGQQELTQILQRRSLAVSEHSAVQTRKSIVTALEQEARDEEQAMRTQVEQDLANHPVARQSQVVDDYFRHTDAPLWLNNTNSPLNSVGTVAKVLTSKFRVLQFALLKDLDIDSDAGGQAIDAISEDLAPYDKLGKKFHVMVDLPYKSYGELTRALMNKPLMGKQAHREVFQAFALQGYVAKNDRNAVQARSALGAALGRRAELDALYGVAEPMAGIRPGSDGSKGGLKLNIAPAPGNDQAGYSETECNNLATRGVCTALLDADFGTIIATNRSLLASTDSVYIAANAVRLRQTVSAAFHRLVQIYVWQDGKRTNGSLEGTMAKVNEYLLGLVKAGWLREGNASVDYKSKKVRIKVYFEPAMPLDEISIEFSEEPFEDEA